MQYEQKNFRYKGAIKKNISVYEKITPEGAWMFAASGGVGS